MKRLFTLILVAMLAANAFAWGPVGHKIVVAIAQRHLTEKAKANIATKISVKSRFIYVHFAVKKRNAENTLLLCTVLR